MEKETIIPHLFEVECPPEKKRVATGKWQTLSLKYLLNKETGVTSCKYLSCDWNKCSQESKTVVLKMPSKIRNNKPYNPHVLWNYETGETFAKQDDDFTKISIEGNESKCRSFFTVFGSVITRNSLTGEIMPLIFRNHKEKNPEYAVPYIDDSGKLMWEIVKYTDEGRKVKGTYEDVKLASINGVNLFMVKHNKEDYWGLLYNDNIIATSKTGNFIKKGFCIFGQIENDRYRFYRLQTSTAFSEVTLEITDTSIILDKKEIPLFRTKWYWEEVTGLTTDRCFFKIESGKAYPVISPENQGDIPKKIMLRVDDEDFVAHRTYMDWVHNYYPQGTVAGFKVTRGLVDKNNVYYNLLEDLDTGAEIVLRSKKTRLKIGKTIYLTVSSDIVVEVLKKKESPLLANKAILNAGGFRQTSEDEYLAYKKSKEDNNSSEDSKEQAKPQQSSTEPEPSLLESKLPELEVFLKNLLQDVENEVSLNVRKDADGKISISIL